MGKYFKYAIGEILLVVIGILIALYINDLNQQRINSKKEIELLKALKIDVEKNIEQFNHYSYLVGIKAEVLSSIIHGTYDTIRIVQGYKDSMNDLNSTRYQYAIPIQDHIFREAVNNGNNSLIQSKEVGRALFNYYTFIEDRRSAMVTSKSNWPSILSSMYPAEHYKTENDSIAFRELSSLGQSILIKKMKDDIDILRPTINEEIQYAIRASRNLNQLKREAKNLIKVLKDELQEKADD